jgi:hypothetical protein
LTYSKKDKWSPDSKAVAKPSPRFIFAALGAALGVAVLRGKIREDVVSKLRFSLLCVPFLLGGPALAQPANDACTILASKLTPDISSQTSYATRFSIYQKIISDERFSSYQTAQSTSLDGSLSVLDYVDLTLGTHSDENSWSKNWSKFKVLTFSSASSSESFASSTNKWNPGVIQALLQGCSQAAQGFYAQVTNVAENHGSFTITVHGIGAWQLEGVVAVPKDAKFTCGDDSNATTRSPIAKVNTIQINCEKDENKTLAVSIVSNEAGVGPFNLLSVADDLRAKANEYDQVVESKFSTLSQQITDLRSGVDGLRQQLNNTVGQLTTMSQQLKLFGAEGPPIPVHYNGSMETTPHCPPGSFLVGLRIGVDDHGNPYGDIRCAKVQPVIP